VPLDGSDAVKQVIDRFRKAGDIPSASSSAPIRSDVSELRLDIRRSCGHCVDASIGTVEAAVHTLKFPEHDGAENSLFSSAI
jgi:hypothetical protein